MPKFPLSYKDAEGKHVKACVMFEFVAMEGCYVIYTNLTTAYMLFTAYCACAGWLSPTEYIIL